MTRISHLLFVVTGVTLFAYLLIYYSMSMTGNGGEYWGFSGTVEPHIAASRAFTGGDYVLLSLRTNSRLNGNIRRVPVPVRCRGSANEIITSIRSSSEAVAKDTDSLRNALEFMEGFNRHMESLMYNAHGYNCEEVGQKSETAPPNNALHGPPAAPVIRLASGATRSPGAGARELNR